MKRFRLLMSAHAAQCAALIGALPCAPYAGYPQACEQVRRRYVAGVEFLDDVDAVVEELGGGAAPRFTLPPSGGIVLEARRDCAADRGQLIAGVHEEQAQIL